jgi:hypothetical protein
MAYLNFEVSYAVGAVPAWEASQILLGITHIYYYGLLVRNEHYARRFNEVFATNGTFISKTYQKQLQISSKDQLFLEVRTQDQLLSVTVANSNNDEAIHASDAMEAIKKLRERLRQERESNNETDTIEITDSMKRERLEGDQEIDETLLQYIYRSQLDEELKRIMWNAAILACFSLLADTIERFEFILVRVSP